MEAENQYIRIKAVLEVVGKPKEYIEKKIREYIESMKNNENLMLVSEKISEAEEHEKVWSLFAEVEVVIKGIANLVGFCIDYMPASIEIVKPDEFYFEQRVFTNFVNDMLLKLHNVDMIAKKIGIENRLLEKNMNNIIRNNLLVLLRFGVDDIEKMSKANGIDKNEVKKFLDMLVKEGRIKEINGIYSLA